MLVRLLLGRGEVPPLAEQVWTCPIAGGRRSVTLRPHRLAVDAGVMGRRDRPVSRG